EPHIYLTHWMPLAAAPEAEGGKDADIRWWKGEATHDEIRAVAEKAATLTAQWAVPSALRYVPTVTTDNCRTPPQPSETVAEALHEIRAAIRDGNLAQGVRLDIIEKIALRALKGADQ